MKEYLKKFGLFIVEKKWFFLWLVICFLIDRITTYVVLSTGQFAETNVTALIMWNAMGHIWSEVLTVLFIVLVFFYVGVFGGELIKKIVLPAFCLIYTWMILGNIVVLCIIVTGNYDFVSIFDWLISINWYVYCFSLAIICMVVVFLVYKIKEKMNDRKET